MRANLITLTTNTNTVVSEGGSHMQKKYVYILIVVIGIQCLAIFRLASSFHFDYAKYGVQLADAIVDIEVWLGRLVLSTTGLIITVQILSLVLLYNWLHKKTERENPEG